jgi:hypothetical protein
MFLPALFAATLSLSPQGSPKQDIKEAGKEVGHAFKEGGKQVGHAAVKGGKAVGHVAKKGGKAVGKGAKETAHGVKDAFDGK